MSIYKIFPNHLPRVKHAFTRWTGTNNLSAELQDRQLLFVHIPKTAGISFGKFLREHFRDSEVLDGAFWESIRKRPIYKLGKYKLIHGHTGYDLSFYLNNPFIITMLRHPVDRLCSIYEYLNQLLDRKPNLDLGDPDLNELVRVWKVVVRRPFAEFLDSPEGPARAALLDNPQARQLAQATPYLLTDLTHEQLYGVAASRLAKIDVVGCSDMFAGSVAVTCHKTGWKLPKDFNSYQLNITEKQLIRASLDKDLRKKIERMCEVDMELYSMAKKRLNDDLIMQRSHG